MAHKRRRLKWRRVDPAVLARKAAKREEARRWRRAVDGGFRMGLALVCVGGLALVTMFEAIAPSPVVTSRSDPNYHGQLTTWWEVAVKGVLYLLRRAGVPDGWIIGGSAGVFLACAAGVVYLVRRVDWISWDRETAVAEAEKAAEGLGERKGD